MSSRVIVLGGGVAGMSAAHELIERGFEVVVLERRNIAGGKARSVPVIDDGRGTSGHQLVDTGVASLNHRIPGEHGFRFFPGFYKHVIDTMRRIPSFDGRKAADHLVPTTRAAFTQYGLPAFEVPTLFPRTTRDAGTLLRDALLLCGPVIDFSPGELAFLRQAIELSLDAHLAAMRMMRPGLYEYQIGAKMVEVHAMGGSEAEGYAPIVGAGPNSTALVSFMSLPLNCWTLYFEPRFVMSSAFRSFVPPSARRGFCRRILLRASRALALTSDR